MGGAGRGGRAHGRGGFSSMMGCGMGGAIDPSLAAQLATPLGQREYLNSQLQQVQSRLAGAGEESALCA